MLRKI